MFVNQKGYHLLNIQVRRLFLKTLKRNVITAEKIVIFRDLHTDVAGNLTDKVVAGSQKSPWGVDTNKMGVYYAESQGRLRGLQRGGKKS